jgi:hypothetical protein
MISLSEMQLLTDNFYVLRERWSFHTAKTHFRHSPEAGLMRLHVIASGNIPLPAGTEAAA